MHIELFQKIFWGNFSTFCKPERYIYAQKTKKFINISLKVKTHYFANIIFLRLILYEIPKKYKIGAPPPPIVECKLHAVLLQKPKS
jgi:hypothetical protein